MKKLKFGDLVLLSFPYSDQSTFKKRPALVICDLNDEDVILCRITSHLYNSEFDVLIHKWKEAGLLLPSVVRVHKMATIDKDLIDFKIGNLYESEKEEVHIILKAIIDNL